jgi:hypothetical protein
MTDKPSFQIDIGALKTRKKDSSAPAIARSDEAAEHLGFVDRAPKKKRGRKPSPRTGQVHAKVMPQVARAIANEARHRGVQQGVILEEAWALYVAQKET